MKITYINGDVEEVEASHWETDAGLFTAPRRYLIYAKPRHYATERMCNYTPQPMMIVSMDAVRKIER